MLDIPFDLETVPADHADRELERLTKERKTSVPVLLGDADIFSAEWAEVVDEFEPPEALLQEASALDADAWFADHLPAPATDKSQGMLGQIASLPVQLVQWPVTGQKPEFLSKEPTTPEDAGIAMLRSQLVELEASGEATEAELAEIREIIDDIAAEGTGFFPDPVDYVIPRHGDSVAAGMVDAKEPWEAAAWLQHGTYALCAPRPVLVAHCKWLWEQHGGRIITASTDHIGFQMERPIETLEDAGEILTRFTTLGASEVNADYRGSNGASLVGAARLWVWWD